MHLMLNFEVKIELKINEIDEKCFRHQIYYQFATAQKYDVKLQVYMYFY